MEDDFDDLMDDADSDMTEDERFEEEYGTRQDWLEDKDAPWSESFTDVYKAFLDNECVGILSYEEAKEAYKRHSGRPPELIEECPEIEWVERQRREIRERLKAMKATPAQVAEMELDIRKNLPFEPWLQMAY